MSGYATYRLYTSETGRRKRQQLARLSSALFLFGDAAQHSAESLALISADLKRFLLSDDDELPRSLRQAVKIAHSPDFQHSCTLLSAALTRGLLRGFTSPRSSPPRPYPSEDDSCTEIKEICLVSCVNSIGSQKGRKQCSEKSDRYAPGSKVIGPSMYLDKARQQSQSKPSEELSERLLGKLFSEPGVNFASAVVGNAACNIVKGMLDGFENQSVACGSAEGDASSKLIDVLCSQQCKGLINECIQMFVSTAVAVYIDKTKDVNFYNDMVAGITNPSHKDPMKDLLTTVCNGAVETLVKSSHSVMFGEKSGEPDSRGSWPGSRIEELSEGPEITQRQMINCQRTSSNDGYVCSSSGSVEGPPLLLIPHKEGTSQDPEIQACRETAGKSEQAKGGGIQEFIEGFSKTLAIPSNHRLVVDVAGTVTSEAVRSFVDVIVSTISSNLHGKVQRGWGRVKGGALEQVSAMQVHTIYKDVAFKAFFLASICLAICLHVLTCMRIEV